MSVMEGKERWVKMVCDELMNPLTEEVTINRDIDFTEDFPQTTLTIKIKQRGLGEYLGTPDIHNLDV